MRETPATSTSITPRRPAYPSSPTVIQIGRANDVAATTILSLTPDGVVARPHVGSAADGRFVLGPLEEGSDTVLVAWARADAVVAPRLEVRVEEYGSVLARLVATAHVTADIPEELIGVHSTYVIAVRVRAGQLVVTTPPEHAIVSLASIAHWMRGAETAAVRTS